MVARPPINYVCQSDPSRCTKVDTKPDPGETIDIGSIAVEKLTAAELGRRILERLHKHRNVIVKLEYGDEWPMLKIQGVSWSLGFFIRSDFHHGKTFFVVDSSPFNASYLYPGFPMFEITKRCSQKEFNVTFPAGIIDKLVGKSKPIVLGKLVDLEVDASLLADYNYSSANSSTVNKVQILNIKCPVTFPEGETRRLTHCQLLSYYKFGYLGMMVVVSNLPDISGRQWFLEVPIRGTTMEDFEVALSLNYRYRNFYVYFENSRLYSIQIQQPSRTAPPNMPPIQYIHDPPAPAGSVVVRGKGRSMVGSSEPAVTLTAQLPEYSFTIIPDSDPTVTIRSQANVDLQHALGLHTGIPIWVYGQVVMIDVTFPLYYVSAVEIDYRLREAKERAAKWTLNIGPVVYEAIMYNYSITYAPEIGWAGRTPAVTTVTLGFYAIK